MSEAIAQKLDEARALIEPQGAWAQGAYAYDEHHRVSGDPDIGSDGTPVCFCALGALSMAVRGTPNADVRTYELVPFEELLCRAVDGTEANDIVDWNDTPGRTQAEVIQAFRKAAELARQEQSA